VHVREPVGRGLDAVDRPRVLHWVHVCGRILEEVGLLLERSSYFVWWELRGNLIKIILEYLLLLWLHHRLRNWRRDLE